MKNCVAQISSVYPCTTISALTTLETGLTPMEHGWLGWALYFKELNECVELYTGKIFGTERYAKDRYIAWNVKGFKNIFEQIKEVNSGVACCRISPFGNDFILMSGIEALEKGYFGNGEPHEHVYDVVGDYIAFTTENRAIWFRNEDGTTKDDLACHAGLKREEMIVPLILIET